MKHFLASALTLCSLFVSCSAAESTKNQQGLPKVLIIGDSISMSYTPFVKKLLEGSAQVSRNPGNAEYTGTGVKNIDKWLGDTQWDVIHFNWGLWDMYGWEYTEVERSPAAYEKRLENIVSRLEKTNAKLIWATTTPVCPDPETSMLRRWQTKVVITPTQEKKYLDAALRVMKKHKVEINDLHGLMAPQLKKYAIAGDNIHFTQDGSKLLAKQVSEQITLQLKAEKK